MARRKTDFFSVRAHEHRPPLLFRVSTFLSLPRGGIRPTYEMMLRTAVAGALFHAMCDVTGVQRLVLHRLLGADEVERDHLVERDRVVAVGVDLAEQRDAPAQGTAHGLEVVARVVAEDLAHELGRAHVARLVPVASEN